uniref:CUB_2 domain-containing protein n=1 Tax=Caenorhabditis tropicalis TaxID=1561998 RepID=A0A1I7TTN3_9PELO
MDVITSITPSGGLYHQTIYEIATRTNGICGFEPDHLIYLLTTYFDNVDMPYTVYSVNVPVSGNGSISLPSFTPSCTYDCIFWPTMTIQDHGPLDTYRATKLTLKNILHNDTHYVGDDSDIAYETIRLNDAYLLPNISYEITLDYEYSNSQTQILQIRIFSQSSIDYWLPYD